MTMIKSLCYTLTLIGLSLSLVQCKTDKPSEASEGDEIHPAVTIEKANYGKTSEGESVDLYTLKNSNGMEIDVITYGGIITKWTAPDKEGVYKDIVLGFDSLSQYLASNPYFGAIIGRYGNRIAKGKFTIDDIEYSLATNDGPNHLHGGVKGFDKVVWSGSEQVEDHSGSLKLSYLSKDMEEGYPGNLNVVVTYTLKDDNTLDVLYEASTDKKTFINLTQHSYFNLSGDFTQTILGHEIMLEADSYLPVDATLIPTGRLADVTDTPFDFRIAKTIGRDINAADDQLKKGLGYDHCWVLNDQNNGSRRVASAYHSESGRYLEIFSDEPAIQFYTGNFLDGTLPVKGGTGTYAHRTGFCLETQHYPDSPNKPDFPSVLLNPGDQYTTKTSFKFSIK